MVCFRSLSTLCTLCARQSSTLSTGSRTASQLLLDDFLGSPDGLWHRDSSSIGKESSLQQQNEQYLRDAIDALRFRPPVVQFNAELAVLSPGAPASVTPRSVVRPGIGQSGAGSLGQNSTSSSSASSSSASFNPDVWGDLFMRDIYLQGDLDLDEITAVAGFVSKEVLLCL